MKNNTATVKTTTEIRPTKTLYVESDSLEFKEARTTGWLRVIIGDAYDVKVRALQYKGKRKQDFFGFFSIPGRDHQIHREFRRVYRASQVRWVPPSEDVQSFEAFDFKVNPESTDEEMKLQVLAMVEKVVNSVGGSVESFAFVPTSWQRKAIKFVADSWSEGKETLVLELAARFGKTGTYLTLLDYSDAQVMVVANYFKSVNSSFANTVLNHFQDKIHWVNIGDKTFEADFASALASGKKVVVGAALHSKSQLLSRIKMIQKVEKRFVVVDEADFGSHTKAQFEKVKSLRDGCPLILTTGTNADRAVSSHKIDGSLSVTYFDMLVMAGAN